MDPGWDGDVELHEDKYWDFSLCTSVSGSGGVGDSAVVDGIDGVGTGGGFGSGCGNSDGAENIGVSWLFGSSFWDEQWQFCGGVGAGGFWTDVVV